MSEAFTFDEASHVYRVADRVVPSVTRVLDHTGLVDYSMIREEILERASERGQRVHRARHYYDENDLNWASVREDESGFIESWIAFRRASGYVPILTEFQFVFQLNGQACGMRLDSAGFFPKSNRLAIIDCKTGAVGWWTSIQTAGYAIGLPSQPQEKATVESALARFLLRDRYAVRLLADGKIGQLKKFDSTADFHTFAAALYLTHIKINRGVKLREERNEEEPCQSNL